MFLPTPTTVTASWSGSATSSGRAGSPRAADPSCPDRRSWYRPLSATIESQPGVGLCVGLRETCYANLGKRPTVWWGDQGGGPALHVGQRRQL